RASVLSRFGLHGAGHRHIVSLSVIEAEAAQIDLKEQVVYQRAAIVTVEIFGVDRILEEIALGIVSGNRRDGDFELSLVVDLQSNVLNLYLLAFSLKVARLREIRLSGAGFVRT